MANFSRNGSAVHLPVVQSDIPSDPDSGYYSHSHLARFGQCPRSYRLHYVDRLPADLSTPQQLGTLIHRVLADVVSDHVRSRQNGPLDADYAAESFQLAWAGSDLREPALFNEGRAMIARWIEREGDVPSARVLGVELPFTLHLRGDVAIRGTMDRVDRIGDDAIRIRDYKTTRLPPRREDVEESLQLAIYDLAAELLWPWAKRVELAVDLLRHDLVMRTERTPEQRETTRQYVLATVAQIRRGEDRTEPGAQCVTCDHRSQCGAYPSLTAGMGDAPRAPLDDLFAVSREREELGGIIKAAVNRKDVLDDVLRRALERDPEIVVNRRRYSLSVAMYRQYLLEPTVAILAEAGVPADEARTRLAAVDHDALRGILRELYQRMPMPQACAIEDRIDAQAANPRPVTRLVSYPVRP